MNPSWREKRPDGSFVDHMYIKGPSAIAEDEARGLPTSTYREELAVVRTECDKWRALALRLLEFCPMDHDSKPCDVCGFQLTFDGIVKRDADGRSVRKP